MYLSGTQDGQKMNIVQIFPVAGYKMMFRGKAYLVMSVGLVSGLPFSILSCTCTVFCLFVLVTIRLVVCGTHQFCNTLIYAV